jgi:hypothetical protein
VPDEAEAAIVPAQRIERAGMGARALHWTFPLRPSAVGTIVHLQVFVRFVPQSIGK